MLLSIVLITSIILLAIKTLAEANESKFAQSLSKVLSVPIMIIIIVLLFGISIKIGNIIPELVPYFTS